MSRFAARLLVAIAIATVAPTVPVAAGASETGLEPAPPPVPRSDAVIGEGAGRHAGGRIAVNQAAGDGNAQANLAAIALSDGGLGLTHLNLQQQAQAGSRQRDASARIDGNAFAGGQGVLSVNQVAGSGNTQANLFAIGQSTSVLAVSGIAGGAGFAGLDDAALAAVAGENPTEGAETPPRLREAVIASGAFRGSEGVVQVNQTAGVGNSSANAIVLLLPGGAP